MSALSMKSSARAAESLLYGRTLLGMVLLAGCALGTAAVLMIAPAHPAVPVDAELDRLLHGMALVKALFIAAMSALLIWRLGRPVVASIAAGYLFSLWTMAVATALIWQSTQIAVAALLFHGAGFAFLLLALKDERILPAGLRRLTDRQK